jgi:hypothetical protein
MKQRVSMNLLANVSNLNPHITANTIPVQYSARNTSEADGGDGGGGGAASKKQQKDKGPPPHFASSSQYGNKFNN